jgi:ribosomal protein S27E
MSGYADSMLICSKLKMEDNYMAFLGFTCEHCNKKSYRFVRPSQTRSPVPCPACKKTIFSGGAPATTSSPAISGGQQASCVITR